MHKPTVKTIPIVVACSASIKCTKETDTIIVNQKRPTLFTVNYPLACFSEYVAGNQNIGTGTELVSLPKEHPAKPMLWEGPLLAETEARLP